MALEIERKFRVTGDGWKQHVVRVKRLCQGYLATTDRVSIRVRVVDDEAASLTVKTAEPGAERHEYEYAIPIGDAEALLARCEGWLISKLRHIVPIGGLVWEIDVFEESNAGLVIAEVELASSDWPIERPDWLGAEITDDKRFYNASLACAPFASWPDD